MTDIKKYSLPTQDQQHDWHEASVSELFKRLAEVRRILWHESISVDGDDSFLISEVSDLVNAAYAAGRLNPLPLRPSD